MKILTTQLAILISKKRGTGRCGHCGKSGLGKVGIRETAKEIGVSPATLSRVERQEIPSLETYAKICKWLKIDPGKLLRATK